MLGRRVGRGPARDTSDLLGPSLLDLEASLFRFCLFSELMAEGSFSIQRRQQIWGSLISLLQAGIISTSTAQLHGWALPGTWEAKGLLCEGRGGGTSVSVTLLGLLMASGEEQRSLASYPGATAQLTPLTPVTPGPRASR